MKDIVGRGWAFPATVDPAGQIRLVGGHHDIDAAIAMIVGTVPGERVMRPEFGCRVWEYVFAPITPKTMGGIEQAVREALLQWEPRINLTRVVATPGGEGIVEVVIDYVIRATNDHRNLVYPFYVIPREVSG